MCGEVCICVEKCVYVWNPNFTKNFLGFWFIFVRGCFLYRGGWGLRLEAYKKKGGGLVFLEYLVIYAD